MMEFVPAVETDFKSLQNQLMEGEVIANCPSCTLFIRVLYELVFFSSCFSLFKKKMNNERAKILLFFLGGGLR